MKNTILFDEAMSLEQILRDYETTARKCHFTGLQLDSGKDIIRTMHQTLKQVTNFGNQTRIEKVIEGGTSKLKIVAVSKNERSWISKLASILGWK